MELSGLKILVTGAAGFIGSHLSEVLAKDEEHNELVLLDDFSVGSRENLASLEPHARVRIVEADVTDLDAVREHVAGVDVVFHLAVSCLRTSLGDPHRSHDVNAGGTLNVCVAAHEHAVKRLIYVSSSEVYGSATSVPMSEEHPVRPTTVYGASKLAGEEYALAFWRTHGMPVSVVRPFNTYGPREPHSGARAEVIPRFILRVLRGQEPVIYGSGEQTRDFTFIEDTVRGITLAAACDTLVGDVVNVAYGREVSIARIAELVSSRLGRAELRARNAEPRPGDVDRHYADIRKAARMFDYEPRVDLDAGLTRTLDWFQAQRIHERAEADDAATPNW
jgi:UDP-glucose 4-epimerase